MTGFGSSCCCYTVVEVVVLAHPPCLHCSTIIIIVHIQREGQRHGPPLTDCLPACTALSLTRKTHNIKWNAVRFNYRKIFYNCDTVLSRSLCMVGRSPARTIYRLNIAPQFYVLSSTDTVVRARATAAKAAFH